MTISEKRLAELEKVCPDGCGCDLDKRDLVAEVREQKTRIEQYEVRMDSLAHQLKNSRSNNSVLESKLRDARQEREESLQRCMRKGEELAQERVASQHLREENNRLRTLAVTGEAEAPIIGEYREKALEEPEIRTRTGKVLGEDDIAELSAEAERGYNVGELEEVAPDPLGSIAHPNWAIDLVLAVVEFEETHNRIGGAFVCLKDAMGHIPQDVMHRALAVAEYKRQEAAADELSELGQELGT